MKMKLRQVFKKKNCKLTGGFAQWRAYLADSLQKYCIFAPVRAAVETRHCRQSRFYVSSNFGGQRAGKINN
jgi:hypothetical protein